ncbi:MAG: hypothetical protein JSW11_00490 [Candidatus Heimdallarchaeota archaeon]|nr:MAG: hypothetical protein JSW11_00490 [Candidatus Heimdallarchaeota archaeon]
MRNIKSLPNKYCSACGAIWVPDEVFGDRPTCQCSCVPVGTIYYPPVSIKMLKIRPIITKEARKYIDGPFDRTM